VGDVPRPRPDTRLGRLADGPIQGGSEETEAGAPYAYLIYPHKPIVAYLPQTRTLLNEYCVAFPDETRPYGSARLPDSDDVLAKWMALTGDERHLVASANMHLPGARSTRARCGATSGACRCGSASARHANAGERARVVSRPREPDHQPTPDSTSSTAPAPSPKGPHRAAARAYLKGIGYDDEDLAKPIIGVASTWIETMPCNFHLRALAAKVKDGHPRGRRHADGVQHDRDLRRDHDGHERHEDVAGQREVIADSIELVARGHLFDAVVALSGCDKTIPAP
jgi:hypothetical protein